MKKEKPEIYKHNQTNRFYNGKVKLKLWILEEGADRHICKHVYSTTLLLNKLEDFIVASKVTGLNINSKESYTHSQTCIARISISCMWELRAVASSVLHHACFDFLNLHLLRIASRIVRLPIGGSRSSTEDPKREANVNHHRKKRKTVPQERLAVLSQREPPGEQFTPVKRVILVIYSLTFRQSFEVLYRDG